MSIILSIIIPNYNGVEFLRTCLQSVFAEITDVCEVVVVDDGSTDESVDVIQQTFSNALASGKLKLISIENSGPGEARNVGVKASCGTYIAFLDSDDFILPGFFERILAILEENAPDIMQFSVLRVLDDRLTGQNIVPCHRTAEGLYDMDEVRADIFGVGKWFPFSRVFSRDIILKNPFPSERVFYEDLLTLPFIFFQSFNIYLLPDHLIAYRDNPKGTTRNHKPDHARTMLDHFQRVSALPPSVARDIMLVQVARSIVFFTLELKLREMPLRDLRSQIRALENKQVLASHLDGIDRFFLRFPLLYTAIDWARKRLRRTKT
ncbi:glycosyltransferase [Yoonia sp.]|nr:glycosyltransferase [Yoonia sp.]MDB4240818.1 glycosyltransferase [Yoonia sp.]